MSHFSIGKNIININEAVNAIFINGEFAGSFWVINISRMYGATSSATKETKSFVAKHDAENWIIAEYIKERNNE